LSCSLSVYEPGEEVMIATAKQTTSLLTAQTMQRTAFWRDDKNEGPIYFLDFASACYYLRHYDMNLTSVVVPAVEKHPNAPNELELDARRW
jgi:hypothetical protein